MSDLTPEEKRTVEFAMQHWLSRRACDVERSRLYQEVVQRVRAQRYGQESAESAADYAIGAHDGYLAGDRDGFKRGVLALTEERDALRATVQRKHEDGYAWMQLAQERGQQRDALRALLQKCEGYVGVAMRASPDTDDIVRLLSRINAALRGKEKP